MVWIALRGSEPETARYASQESVIFHHEQDFVAFSAAVDSVRVEARADL